MTGTQSGSEGRLILVLGGKGGVGKSLVTAGLATSLAPQGPVVAVDLDLSGGGSLATLLGVEPDIGLGDLLRQLDSWQVQEVQKYLLRADKVRLLAACERVDQRQSLTSAHLEQLAHLLGYDHRHIVVDIGMAWDDRLLTLLGLADLVWVVTTPDLLALRDFRSFWDLLGLVGFPANRRRLLLNQSDLPGGIGVEEIEELLSIRPDARLPYAPRLLEGLNRSQPVSDLLSGWDGLARVTAEALQALPLARFGQGNLPKLAPQPLNLDADWKRRVHRQLLDRVDLSGVEWLRESNPAAEAQIRTRVAREVREILREELPDRSVAGLVEEIVDEAVGFGPIEEFLSDGEVSEVMVNGPHQIYVERRGRVEPTGKTFSDEGEVLRIIERIVAPLGRRIDESSPMVDARLTDGSRVHAIIPPLSLSGPLLTIRKFHPIPLTIEDLLQGGSLTQEMADFLEQAVRDRLNILVSGGTGSGKTTLLNILSSFISPDERIVTIEDSAELRLEQIHTLSLESRPPNLEGRGEVTIRDLVRNALRMRPDRIVVGEVRGGEALDMLQAMNTGHDGSLTTAHANSPMDVISRLETMVLFSGVELPTRAIRDQIASAIDLIVQTARLRSGERKVVEIARVYPAAPGEIQLTRLFAYEDGTHRARLGAC